MLSFCYFKNGRNTDKTRTKSVKFTLCLDINQKNRPKFDFLDYIQFCRQTAAAVCQDKVNGIINICFGRPEKLSDRVERFIKDNNYNIKLQYGAFEDRPYDSKAVWGDDSKIKVILDNEME